MKLFKDEVYSKLVKYLTASAKKIYKDLGGFSYRRSDLDAMKLRDSDLETKDTQWVGKECQYIGQWNTSNDKRHGRGIAAYTDGAIYEGFWLNGKRHGVGRMIYSNGDVYQGEFKTDKPNGYGVFVSKDNLRQKGEWKDGKLEGDGFEIDENGNIYSGKNRFCVNWRFFDSWIFSS